MTVGRVLWPRRSKLELHQLHYYLLVEQVHYPSDISSTDKERYNPSIKLSKNQVLCKASNVVGQTVINTADLFDKKTDNDVPNLNKDCLTMGTKAKNLIERTTLHELEPLAMQSLHALVSLVHDCVNITDQSQSTEPSTSNAFAVGEKDASKFNVKDAFLLESINRIFYIECLFSHSFADLQKPQVELDGKACAAVGQNGLMALYDTLFSRLDVTSSQLLVTDNNFKKADFRVQLCQTVNSLLALRSIPIFNENDAISTRKAPYEVQNSLDLFAYRFCLFGLQIQE